MLLFFLILIPFISGILCLQIQYLNVKFPRFIALFTILFIFLILIKFWFNQYYYKILNSYFYSNWNIEYSINIIKKFGIDFHIGIDGLSLLMLLLTSLFGFISIICMWNISYKYQGFFYFNLMFLIGSIIGIFISLDLFLFFCFWELSSIPIYFLILIFGHSYKKKQDYKYFSNKFFIYSKVSSFFLLFGILGLVYNYYFLTNIYTFNYNILCNVPIFWYLEYILMFLFFFSFAIKIPLVPFHSWIIDFHTFSPISGTLDISGILLKTSIYSLLRFNIPFFPYSSLYFTYFFFILGVINIFYCSLIAFIEKDIKRIISYGSVANMGFVLIALYSMNFIALEGVIINIITHAISTAALFLLIGNIYCSLKTRKINKISGLWYLLDWVPALFLFFCMSNLGIPGTGNFTGEFLMLLGSYIYIPKITIIIFFGLICMMIYLLRMIQYIFFGISKKNYKFLFQIQYYQKFIFLILCFLIIFFGIFPQKILDTSYYSIMNIYKNFNCLTKN